MVSVLVLIVPNFLKEFVIKMDVSSSGLGVILMQKGQPIASMSKALSL